jgi:hypothetical protein
MWHLLAQGAIFFGLWFLVGIGFLMLWAGLTWVGRTLTAWAERELKNQDAYRERFEDTFCPHCQMSGGNHTPTCEHEWFLTRTHRLVKR